MELTEEAYFRLLEIMPDVAQREPGCYRSVVRNNVALHLEILEQTPYTSHLRLTYFFSDNKGEHADPDAYLRVYHDAKQLEILELKQHVLPVESLYEEPGMENKWKLLQFFNRWLAYCSTQGYLFKQKRERSRSLCPEFTD